jgi:hypothetical protein
LCSDKKLKPNKPFNPIVRKTHSGLTAALGRKSTRMKYLGSIEVRSDALGVNFERWVRLIAEHPHLKCVEPREGTNPFTRAPLTFRTHPGTARVLSEGKEIGIMEWAQDGSNRIAVHGEDNQVIEIALDVAACQSATFFPDAE